ncbi:hypothetical protein YB2330_006283 [Saitoella coloradoensis]
MSALPASKQNTASATASMVPQSSTAPTMAAGRSISPEDAHDTGFVEPLNPNRNTLHPHPEAETAPHEELDPELLKGYDEAEDREGGKVGFGKKIRGEIKVIEGKVLRNRELVEEGRAMKRGEA